jgi:hypothetical protein
MERTTCVGSSTPDEILCGITNFVLHRVRRHSKLLHLYTKGRAQVIVGFLELQLARLHLQSK